MTRIIFKYLPKPIQKLLIRNSLDLSKTDQYEIQNKLAEPESEMKQSFRLVQASKSLFWERFQIRLETISLQSNQNPVSSLN
jgi:hypothetical protein